MELLQDLPFVPKEVLSKFLRTVGRPITVANLYQGYYAGCISDQELQDIQTNLPDFLPTSTSTNTNTNTNSIIKQEEDEQQQAEDVQLQVLPPLQSIDYIQQQWKGALRGQPWYVEKMGTLATSTVVQIIARMQQKAYEQVTAMHYINTAALSMIQQNTTIVRLLATATGSTTLRFNNTRAKYEPDRNVWSASMDVFDDQLMITTSSDHTISSNNINNNKDDDNNSAAVASAAVAALTDGMLDENLSGRISVATPSSSSSSTTTNTKKNKIGLVNAYFIPNEEIKILVVEIQNTMYNLTWKGLQ